MKAIRHALIILLFSSTSVIAAPASDASIKQLLAVTQSQRLLGTMRSQIDVAIDKAIQQALKGNTPSASQQQAITNMKKKMATLLQGELNWEKLEPVYVRIYKESFTEEEVAGMLVFYKTPAGQAVVTKMPLVMQKSLQEIQTTVAGLTPQIQKIQQEFMSEMTPASK